jgi:hypothetical protein
MATPIVIPTTTQHPIMRQIETLQFESGKPFGRLLDAGTGLNSLQWISHIISASKTESLSSSQSSFGLSDDWTAVTASPTMFDEVSREAQRLGIANPQQHLVIGNWFNDDYHDSDQQGDGGSHTLPRQGILLDGEVYDTILVDYVIGAMDAFSPYKQDCFLERLIGRHLNPNGGRLYLIGTEPIPETTPTTRRCKSKSTSTSSNSGNIQCDSGGTSGFENTSLVCRVNNMRDACIKLAGRRCYREYPLEWTLRTIGRLNCHESSPSSSSIINDNVTTKMDLQVVHVSKFNLLHTYDDVHAQLGVARSMLKYIHDGNLCGSLEESIDKLNMEAKRTFYVPAATTRHNHHNRHHNSTKPRDTTTNPTSIHLGFDYLVVVEAKTSSQVE